MTRCLAVAPTEPAAVLASVLVVDDDPLILRAFRRMVRPLDVRLICCGSSEEALALLETESPVLIICDYQLPGMDGLSFLRLAQGRCPGARMVLHTGTTMVPAPSSGIGFLPKPSDTGEIQELVRRCCWPRQTPP